MATYYDAEGNEVEVQEPKDLRAQLKAKNEEATALQERLAALEAEVRQGKIESALSGFDPKVREFVEEFNLDPSTVAEKYGSLFGAKAPEEQTPAGGQEAEPGGEEEAWGRLQAATSGAEGAPREVSQVEADLAKLPDDPAQIAAFMRSLTAQG